MELQISPEHLPHVPRLGEEDRHWENEVVLRVQWFQWGEKLGSASWLLWGM